MSGVTIMMLGNYQSMPYLVMTGSLSSFCSAFFAFVILVGKRIYHLIKVLSVV